MENQNNESEKSLQEQLREIQLALEKYEEDQVGLPKMVNFGAPECLSMPLDLLRKKDPQQLAEFCLELNRYSMYVQRMLNQEKAWEKWGESQLEEAMAPTLKELDPSYGWSERIILAKTSSAAAKSLMRFLRKVRMKIERISYLPNEINRIAESIKDIRYSNIKKEQHG
jgi:predicted HTH domain antitoxin